MDSDSEIRIINKLPNPFNFAASPYVQSDFCQKTLKLVNSNLNVSSWRMCKVILLGDVCVGKTSLVNRFCHEIYDSNYKATIGVDFEVERFKILNNPFTIQIWDTAGQERFKCIAKSYYRKANVIMLVFDCSNLSTLSQCKNWLREALDVNSNDPLKFLIGTKTDLLSKASYEEVEKHAILMANSLGAEYWACSSKNDENVTNLFNRIASLAFDNIMHDEFDEEPRNFFISKSAPIAGVNVRKSKNFKKNIDEKCSNCF